MHATTYGLADFSASNGRSAPTYTEVRASPHARGPTLSRWGWDISRRRSDISRWRSDIIGCDISGRRYDIIGSDGRSDITRRGYDITSLEVISVGMISVGMISMGGEVISEDERVISAPSDIIGYDITHKTTDITGYDEILIITHMISCRKQWYHSANAPRGIVEAWTLGAEHLSSCSCPHVRSEYYTYIHLLCALGLGH